jgi:predicted transposase/invertase (TIGR01784 family)
VKPQNSIIRKRSSEGRKIEEKKDTAKNMLSMGMDIATIAKATGLTEQEIKTIQL